MPKRKGSGNEIRASANSSYNSLFDQKSAAGQPLGGPVLEWLFHEIMLTMWKSFHPTVASLSVTVLNGMGIEALIAGQDGKPRAPIYPDGLRFKTGLCPCMVEKYVHVIPEVVVFINIANDVLSLYKEMAAEEMGNCNDQRAQMEQCAVLTALQKVASEG